METPQFLKRIQALPLRKRKLIFWVIIAISVGILLFFWIRHIQNTMEQIQDKDLFEEINLPELQEELEKSLPES